MLLKSVPTCVFQAWSARARCAPTAPVRRPQTGPAGTLWCWSMGRRRRSSPASPPHRWRARFSATAPGTSPRETAASPTSATTRLCTSTQVSPPRCFKTLMSGLFYSVFEVVVCTSLFTEIRINVFASGVKEKDVKERVLKAPKHNSCLQTVC